jgi:hypothetical protein
MSTTTNHNHRQAQIHRETAAAHRATAAQHHADATRKREWMATADLAQDMNLLILDLIGNHIKEAGRYEALAAEFDAAAAALAS